MVQKGMLINLMDKQTASLTAPQIVERYVELGTKKASKPVWVLVLLGIIAGFIIAMGSAVTNTAAHAVENVSAARIICGLLFPFGLGMVMLLGAELFTGNCMIVVSVIEKKAKVAGMLKNWLAVYIGNMIGAMLTAAACVYSGQLGYSGGMLAVYTIKVAVAKCTLSFGPAVVLGILCNILVCAGVLCSISAKDTTGRIVGAYIPVVFFVLCGFEHSVANMYYIPAGIFASKVPEYALFAAESGYDISSLSWSNFFITNLLPVTIGNIIGGAALVVILWVCHVKHK